jgi:hypothetical protein
VVKHNVKDKKQLNFDIKLARMLVALNCPFEGLADGEVRQFCDEFLAEYHIKNPTTFTWYFDNSVYHRKFRFIKSFSAN